MAQVRKKRGANGANGAKQAKSRHWTREETLHLISVWGERRFQNMFESMVHNHTVWEEIYREVVKRCPKVGEDFGEWVKLKERIEYLKRKYRDCVKHNRRTGSDPEKSPYFEEMDAVLGCRPITNPGEDHVDNRSTGDASDLEVLGTPSSPDQESTINSVDQSGLSTPSGEESAGALEDRSASQPLPSSRSRKRRGKKSQVMEAVEKGLDCIFQHESASGLDNMRFERERLEWEKEVVRNRLDIERRRLDFEMRRLEADERRAKESREFMMQLFQWRQMPNIPQPQFNFGSYPSSYLDHLEGPPAPSASAVSQHSQHSFPL